MAKRVQNLQVVENLHIRKDFCILNLESSVPLPEMKPGQFVQVRVDGCTETFLRRPFALHDVDYENNRIKLLVQIAGKGSNALYQIKDGELLNIIYPLGNSFSMPAGAHKILLIGGGSGIASLYFLAKTLDSQGFVPDILLGFRDSDRIIGREEFGKFGRVSITTEDGSSGEKGFVTNHPLLNGTRFDRIYCCGPEPMMRAVARYARAGKMRCEVSLENLMGCGFGVCLCCIVSTTRGNICSCTEGPVFNINDLKW